MGAAPSSHPGGTPSPGPSPSLSLAEGSVAHRLLPQHHCVPGAGHPPGVCGSGRRGLVWGLEWTPLAKGLPARWRVGQVCGFPSFFFSLLMKSQCFLAAETEAAFMPHVAGSSVSGWPISLLSPPLVCGAGGQGPSLSPTPEGGVLRSSLPWLPPSLLGQAPWQRRLYIQEFFPHPQRGEPAASFCHLPRGAGIQGLPGSQSWGGG